MMKANQRPCTSIDCNRFMNNAQILNNNKVKEPVGMMDNTSQYNKFPQLDEENILAGSEYQNTTGQNILAGNEYQNNGQNIPTGTQYQNNGQNLPLNIPQQSENHFLDDYYNKFSSSDFGTGVDKVGDNIIEYGKDGLEYVKNLFNSLRRNILIRNVCIVVIIFLIILLIIVK